MLWAKQCRKCLTVKAGEEFAWSIAMKDKLHSYCRECVREYDRSPERRKKKAEYHKRPDRVIASRLSAKKFKESEKGREWVRSYVKTETYQRIKERYRQSDSWKAYQKKYAAEAKVSGKRDAWLAAQKLVKKPCEVCHAASADAHHDDYSKPLEVRWLCRTHHKEWHKFNTAKNA